MLRGSGRGAPGRLGAGTLSVAMRRHATADAHSPALPAPARQRSSSSSVSSSSMVPVMVASQDGCRPTKRRGGSSLPAAPACAAAGYAAVPVSAWRAVLARSHRASSRVGLDATKNGVFDSLLAPAKSGQGGGKISTFPRSARATAGHILAHCSLNLVSVRWQAAHGQTCSGRSGGKKQTLVPGAPCLSLNRSAATERTRGALNPNRPWLGCWLDKISRSGHIRRAT